MYARSTTVQAKSSAIDAGIAHVRDEVMPTLADMPGCIGLSLLVDRQSGRCILTTSWESEEAMRDSTERVRSLRDRAVQLFGGDTTRVEQWEVGAMHRDHRLPEGACAQLTWAEAKEPGRFDAAVETYKSMVAAQLEQMPGFCSASLLVDRAGGRGVACETFDSRDAMERNREQLATLRREGTRQAGVDVLDVGDFEIALAHLRVPELV
ncbi:antibiotic biosynthesis monooxygenase [Nocardia spumae]|uniref:antibiotic biosynthesis monooxygenase n=1 Tax=Nocardia spumae TaxID=2887190 RepID=UPI001D13E340|nr:antibiotic biosynthesis monooxygenase [Nocardia spumae]